MEGICIDDAFAAEAQCPADKASIEFCDDQSGLLLEVRPSGGKTFAVRYRDREGAMRWHEIGSHPNVPTVLAHCEAYRLAWAAERGILAPFEKPPVDPRLTPNQRDVLERTQLEIADAFHTTAGCVSINVTPCCEEFRIYR